MAFVRSVAAIGGFTLLSRLLGFARDVLTAALLGTGVLADAFVVALQLPNLFRRLFAEGAFNAAFVPLFSETLAREGADGARRFAEQALAALAFALVLFCGAMMAAMPLVILILAPGFADEPVRQGLAIELSRLTFPYLLLISLATLFAGLLNAVGRFALAAATQILFNLCLIAALLIGERAAPSVAHALAWGVTLSGALQLLWVVLAARRAGFDLRLLWPRLTPPIRRMLGLVLPAAIGAGTAQIGVMANLMLASLLPTGAVSYLFYADRLNQLPLGVIGVAVGTALLPAMSRAIADGRPDRAEAQQNRAIELALLIALPSAAALIALAEPIIRTLFERGAFDARATAATARALAAYAVGLVPFVVMRALVAGFHARQDTTTPVRVAILSTALGLAAGVLLMPSLAHVGLALGVSIGAWTQALLLALQLRRRGHWRPDPRLVTRCLRMLLATFGMTAGLLALKAALAPLARGGDMDRGLALAAMVVGGLILYAALAFLLRAADPAEVRAALSRRRGPTKGG